MVTVHPGNTNCTAPERGHPSGKARHLTLAAHSTALALTEEMRGCSCKQAGPDLVTRTQLETQGAGLAGLTRKPGQSPIGIMPLNGTKCNRLPLELLLP